jgi:hypothetical protein
MKRNGPLGSSLLRCGSGWNRSAAQERHNRPPRTVHLRRLTERIFSVLIRDPSGPAPGHVGRHGPRVSPCFGGLSIPQLARAASHSRGRIRREAQCRGWRFDCLGCDGSRLQGDPNMEARPRGTPTWQALEGPVGDRRHFPRMLR